MDHRIAANRRIWDEWTGINSASELYGADAFRAGRSSLKPIELEQVGDVAGKSLLHLQCHFGQDTLSWARMGARVTGLDLSQEAIGHARRLAAEIGVDARFLCDNVLEATALGEETFDIVYTSYGVLLWLPDLAAWARTIARHLKPGGSFHLVEFHPAVFMLDEDGKEITGSYFHDGAGARYEPTSSYAGGSHPPMECFEWAHSIADVVTSLLDAGLSIARLREFPYCLHPCWPFLVEDAPGQYVIKHYPRQIPLLFAIEARKPS